MENSTVAAYTVSETDHRWIINYLLLYLEDLQENNKTFRLIVPWTWCIIFLCFFYQLYHFLSLCHMFCQCFFFINNPFFEWIEGSWLKVSTFHRTKFKPCRNLNRVRLTLFRRKCQSQQNRTYNSRRKWYVDDLYLDYFSTSRTWKSVRNRSD